MGADVFTRKVAIQPITDKSAATVKGAMRHILSDLGADEDADRRPALIRTDQGKEFASVAEASHDIHQKRDLRDTNGIGIVDRAIQTIKRDLAAEVGKKKGTKWADVAQRVVEDHNEKPQAAVFGAPDTVAKNPVQEFKVLQQNADNYAVDAKNTVSQKDAISKAGYFREPIANGGRSFKPQYGPAQAVERIDSEFVYAKGRFNDIRKGGDGEAYATLLKQARPATVGNFQEKLTLETNKFHTLPQAKTRLKTQALALENILAKQGSMGTGDLLKQVPGLRRATKKYKNLTESNWIQKLYGDRFKVTDGTVRLKTNPSSGSGGVMLNITPPPAPVVVAPLAPTVPTPKKKDAAYFRGLKQAFGSKHIPV